MTITYLPIIIFTLIILLYIAYQDIKYREINIISLIVLAIVSVTYLGLFIFKKDFSLWQAYFVQIGITFVFVLIFYILGKISSFTYIGEGDLYTILALSFTNIYNALFSMFILFFSLILTLLIPIFIFIYNVYFKNYPKYSFFRSTYLMFLGYPLKVNRITSFYTPLENFVLKEDKVISKITYRPNIDPESEIISIKKFAKKYNILRVWVSPLIPFVIMILLGYIFVILLYFFKSIDFLLNLFI